MKNSSNAAADVDWDLACYFPGVDSAEFAAFEAALKHDIARFAPVVASLAALNAGNIAQWTNVLLELEQLEAQRDHLLTYLTFSKAVAPADEAIAEAEAHSLDLVAALKSARAPLLSALSAAADDMFSLLISQPALADTAFSLAALRHAAQHALPVTLEKLAAELEADGLYRWARLAASTLASATIAVTWPSGETEDAPFAHRYELFWDERASVRRSAFDGLNATMQRAAPVLAHCLNGSAGFDQTLHAWRGIEVVDEIMLRNGVSQSTVAAMMDCVRAEAPAIRQYLHTKAKLLGLPSLGVQDRSAPLPVEELRSFTLGEARERIVDSFRTVSTQLADTAVSMFRDRRIEAALKPGRQPGGFCMGSPMARETHIYMNYGGSFNSVTVLAHELGHAFHTTVNFALRPWRQGFSAVLGETAAILCEHLVRRKIFEDEAQPKRVRQAALAAQLDSAVNYLLRIPRDYEFELAFLAERKAGDVGVTKLCAMSRELHAVWFGDALSGDGGDEWAWAYNHIFMEPGLRLYNFPYTFGYLLSSCIADRFRREGDSFTPTYVAFLNATGSMPAEEAIRSTLGYDVTTPTFWQEALARVTDEIALLAALADDAL